MCVFTCVRGCMGMCVKRDIERAGTNGKEWKTIAEDRGGWRELTSKVEEATK